MVTGDFNKDGFCDIAVLDSPESGAFIPRVTILLGGTAKDFSQRRVTVLGGSLSLIRAADLDNDGALDLIVSDGSSEITPLLNTGDATFVPGPPLSVPSYLSALAVSDVDRDGRPDVVVGGSDSIYIMLGTGDGSFHQYQATAVPTALRYPTAMAMGDVNQDGNVDFVLSASAAAGIVYGDGAGKFPTSRILSTAGVTTPGPVAILDMNIDGRPDIVLSNAGDLSSPQNTLTIFYSTSDGGFAETAPIAVGPGPSTLATADVSGDGNADLLVGCIGVYLLTPAAGVTVLVSSVGGAQIRGREIPIGSTVLTVAAGDFDGDLHTDCAVLNVYDATMQPTVSITFGSLGGDFLTRTDIPTLPDPIRVIARDFDGDGNVDLAIASDCRCAGPGAVSVFLGTPNGSYQPPTQYTVGRDPSSLAASDINGDSYLDLVVANANAGTLSLLLGNGDGTFRSGGDLASGNHVTDLALVDLNGDNAADLVLIDTHSSNGICVMLGNGDGTFRAKQCYGAASFPAQVALSDLNADGNMDAVVGNNSSGATKITVMLGNGDGSFRAGTDITVNYYSYLVRLADLNHDGRLDLITTLGYQLAWFPGNGDGTFGTRRDIAFLPSPIGLAVADIDGDGNIDLATTNSLTSAVSVLLGDGNGAFSSPRNYSVGAYPSDLVAVDYSHDGRPDLITVNVLGGSTSHLLNLSTARPQDHPPSVVALDSLSGAEGTVVEAHATASDPDGDVIVSLTVTPLPAGATFTIDATNTSGVLSWTPNFTQAGTYDVTFTATSGSPIQSDSANTVIRIANTDQPPAASAPSAETGSEGTLLSFRVAASDPDGDVITGLTATGTAITAGGTFTPGVGDSSGTFTWTPSFGASAGSPYNVTFTASNALNGSATTLVTVEPCAVSMGVDFQPNALNLRSMGHWVTAYLEPPTPFTPADIDTPSIRLNGNISVDLAAPIEIGDYDGDGIPDLTVKFNRAAVELTLSEGDSVPVTILGTVGGQCFHGTDYIRMLRAVVSAPAAGSTLYPGMTTAVRWTTPSGIHIQSVAILSSADDGATWHLDSQGLPNTGSADWIAPSVSTDKAKVAVVLVESADETGYIVDGVLGTSGTFIVGSVAGVDAGTNQEFALRAVTPNPTQQALSVTFSLPNARPATIEVFDVIGRRVAVREVGSLGPGSRTVTLGERSVLSSGVYLVRLRQAGRSLTTRAVLVR
jgi:hypothetical protein